MLESYRGFIPTIAPDAWVHPASTIIGRVTVGSESSIWPGVSLRGDEEPIVIGSQTSIQDNSTIHTYGGLLPTRVGCRVTVGHNVVLHGCSIGDDCLIGMGSVLLDGVKIGDGSFVAAGSLIPPGKTFPPGSFILGSPAKRVRDVTEKDQASIRLGWTRYVEQARIYLEERGSLR